MIQTAQATTDTLPQTLEAFLEWEPNDGSKYEWNDGEVIKFTGMNEKQAYIGSNINRVFARKGYFENATLLAEQNTHLSGIQLRRPDIAYLTNEQLRQGGMGEEMIPRFVVEVISTHDLINQLERKITEYFKAGVQVIWVVMPERQKVYVHTSPRDVKACIEDDICSAAPVLPDFEISVNDMLMLPQA